MAILFPELSNQAVKEFMDTNDTDLDLWFDDLGIQDAMDKLKEGQVDGVIVGASHTTAEVIKTGLSTIGSDEKLVSSFFIMRRDGQEMFFADCAVNPNPDSEKLAKIAAQTCKNVERLGHEPTVAFLSFSTNGSADHEMVDKVRNAREIFSEQHPEIVSYGDIQFDAAWDNNVYKSKTGLVRSTRPNVFVFPDLNSGNIAYKMVQRLAGYTAIGPILQGFNRPIYDLSRGVDALALKEIAIVANKLIDSSKIER